MEYLAGRTFHALDRVASRPTVLALRVHPLIDQLIIEKQKSKSPLSAISFLYFLDAGGNERKKTNNQKQIIVTKLLIFKPTGKNLWGDGFSISH